MFCWEDMYLVKHGYYLICDWGFLCDAIDFIPEKLDRIEVFCTCWEDIERIAHDPEISWSEIRVRSSELETYEVVYDGFHGICRNL